MKIYEKFFEQVSIDIHKQLETMSFNKLCKVCGMTAPVMAKLRDKTATSPMYETLSKLSTGLGYNAGYYITFLQYLDGHLKTDPRIDFKIEKLCLDSKDIESLMGGFFEIIYNSDNSLKTSALLLEDLKEHYKTEGTSKEFQDAFKSMREYIDNPSKFSLDDSSVGAIVISLSNIYRFNENILLDKIYELTPLLIAKENDKSTKTNGSSNRLNKPFRYEEQHYEKRPVFKATGGTIKQYIDDNCVGHSDRMEWGYMKNMPHAFFVEIEGDSMTGSGILDGDYCLVNPSADVVDSDIVLAVSVESEATVKKFKKTPSGVMLLPTNSSFEPVFISSKEVDEHWRFYKVIESRHKF